MNNKINRINPYIPINMYIRAFVFVQALLWQSTANAFNLPNVFGGSNKVAVTAPPFASVKKLKEELLQAVSYTSNGKTATPEKQAEVLKLVRNLELAQPPSPQLLEDTNLATKLLDGVWYLQYTSPSKVGDDDDDEFPDSWKPQFAEEGDANIETRQVKAQGSISAVGVKVDTSNRLVEQIFDIQNRRVVNNVDTDWGNIKASGSFRPSPNVPNRALVSFDSIKIQFGKQEDSPTIDLGFVFSILAALRRSKDNGWLETTFVDESIRIGRGNKGTMFVLTRDREAVKP